MAVTATRLHRATELVPVTRERLADLETPVSAFAKLRALGGAFLLESAEGGERIGRYSFIGVAPRAVLYFRDGQVAIDQVNGPDPALSWTAARGRRGLIRERLPSRRFPASSRGRQARPRQ